MRKQKRFTPQLLARYQAEERGLGIKSAYTPWHRVSRSDPSSRGRSHIQRWGDRQIELLSDVELLFLFFTTMISNVEDCREQFPLAINSATHELSKYSVHAPLGNFKGTSQIANDLKIKHPICRDGEKTTFWTMTTDLLLTITDSDNGLGLLALSIKKTDDLSKREKQKLGIEREYWLSRNVPWLLLTPNLCHPLIIDLLACTRGWALSEPVESNLISLAIMYSRNWENRSLTFALRDLEQTVGDLSLAQNVFWQAVWRGNLRLDLRRGWRPHEPLKFLSHTEFMALNPIAMRRTAWI
jgi:hypothetical protein